MRQLFFLSVICLALFSCDEDDVVLPQSTICKLTEYRGTATSNPEIYAYYEDSIVCTQLIGTGPSTYKTKYTYSGNTIYRETRIMPSNELEDYGTYYLDQSGYIDSFIRKNGTTDEINYRNYVTRDSENRVIRDISRYNTYGHDKYYYYDENGDFSYGIEIGEGTQTYNDTIIYTLDMTKPNNFSPQYILEDLKGKTSAHHVIRKQYLDRTTLISRRENRYTISDLDSDGNPSTIKYEIDYDPTSTFEAEYSYDRSFTYQCD